MSRRTRYLIGAIIVWIAILAASAVTLAGTPYFGQMLPILGGGVAWFVVIVPAALFGSEGDQDRSERRRAQGS